MTIAEIFEKYTFRFWSSVAPAVQWKLHFWPTDLNIELLMVYHIIGDGIVHHQKEEYRNDELKWALQINTNESCQSSHWISFSSASWSCFSVERRNCDQIYVLMWEFVLQSYGLKNILHWTRADCLWQLLHNEGTQWRTVVHIALQVCSIFIVVIFFKVENCIV